MLVEMAIGDAYGAGFEYAPASFVAENNQVSGYVRHPRHELVPGAYTDDTQMALALTEALVEADAWTPDYLAERFVTAFHRDPRPGYAQGFGRLLQEVRTGSELLARIRPHSDKSGGAMRAPPLGVFADSDTVMARCRVQARITHDTDSGIRAAQAAALMLHFTLHGHGPRSDLGRYLSAHLGGDWSPDWRGKVGAKGWMSVKAAIRAVTDGTSLADVLSRCVAFTGDTDTVAAIAMPAAACAEDLPDDLPGALRSGLEDGPFGTRYLQSLDARWLSMVGDV